MALWRLMTHRFACRLLFVLVLLLLIGTQMPGALRAGIENSLRSPFLYSIQSA